MRLLVCMMLLASTVGANAREIVLGREGSRLVFVWRDGEARGEASDLIAAGVHETNPALVMRLLSCTVGAGTKAIVTDGGFASSTVLIIEGKESGCRGDISNENIRR